MLSRIACGAVLLGALLGALAGPARARERVVVLDRGRAARENDATWQKIAGNLVRSGNAHLVIYGTREDGRARIGAVERPLDDVLASSPAGWSFEGLTDPRKALEYVARRRKEKGPLDVFLVGPFSDGEGTVTGWGARWQQTWLETSPEGSRILPIGLDDAALALLGDDPGLTVAGWLVHALDRVEAVPQPYSPFDGKDGRRRSRLELMLGLAAIGKGLETAPYDVSTDDPDDEIEVRVGKDRLTVLIARRPDGAGEIVHVHFQPVEDPRVLQLVPPPPVLDVRAGVLGEDARLLGPDGAEAPPFRALGVQADAPQSATYALLRSATGKPIPWRIRDEGGTRPRGLKVSLDPETERSPEVLGRDLRLVFEAEPGRPVDAKGTLLIDEPEGRFSFRLPYEVSAPPGQVRVHLVAPATPQGLPFAGDPPWQLSVTRLDANAPDTVTLVLEVEPAEVAGALRIERSGERSPLSLPWVVPVGETTPFEVSVDDPAHEFPGARISVALLPAPGVRGETSGQGTLRARRPRIGIENLQAAHYVVRGGAVEADPPLRLVLDPDGGDPAWRRHLASVPPTLTDGGQAPLGWRLEETAPGRWDILPNGTWRGPARAVFASRDVEVPVEVRWEAGQAPEATTMRIEVPARWGKAGWILVALAALALVLGVVVAFHMRPPPLEGTLLYAIEGKEGAVGRLDLAPVGRGRAVLHADGAGRLSLEGRGTPIATLHATRVGGFLHLPQDAPGSASHLLVDGLEVSTARHRLRYVSGREDDAVVDVDLPPVPDLLGPEFDLEGGRIGAVDPRPSPPPGRGTEPGADDPRSQ